MAAMSVPAMAAWILIYFSDGNMFMIFMARFIKGVLTMTAVWQVVYMCFKEVSDEICLKCKKHQLAVTVFSHI